MILTPIQLIQSDLATAHNTLNLHHLMYLICVHSHNDYLLECLETLAVLELVKAMKILNHLCWGS